MSSTLKQRVLRDASDSLASVQTIVSRLVSRDKAPSKDDLHALRTAANQARQATKELDALCGMVEFEGSLS